MINLNKVYDTICFSGGGIHGIMCIGALYYLENNKYIDLTSFKTFAGTSSGAIIAFMLALDYSINEIYEFINLFNLKTLEAKYTFNNLFENYGINDGLKFKYMFSKFIKNKYDVDDLTFKDLFVKTNKTLLVIGTNYSNQCEEIFSYDTTPDMSIILAIRISISIPILFTPVLYNNSYYLDGALINNFPFNHCNKNSTLGLLITSKSCKNNTNTNNFIQDIMIFFKTILEIIITSISMNKYSKDDENDIIKIPKINNKILNYDYTDEEKKQLLNHGAICEQNFIENKNIPILN